jgi:hypothetical protein
MPAVKDRPRQASESSQQSWDLDPLERDLLYAPWPDPQQGVIEEARRRQQRRRARGRSAVVIAAALIAVVSALIEFSGAKPAHTGMSGRGLATTTKAVRSPGFNVRLTPTLEVGRTGWQVFYEEAGKQLGSTSSGPTVSQDAYLTDEGESSGRSRLWTTRLITAPDVAAVLIEGETRVPTVPLPGLPYGYRAARILTPIESTETTAVSDGGPRPSGEGPRSLVPLEAQGRPIGFKQEQRTPLQAVVRSWQYPGRTQDGSCGLRANPMPGLTVHGGQTATAIRPYSAVIGHRQIVGHAFLPCASVAYELERTPLRALILLDAADPSARAAALPDFKPMKDAPGLFDQGGLTAKREGNAWLIAAQGSGVAQRVALLRHLTALVKLDSSSVPASAGVALAPPMSRRSQTQGTRLLKSPS